MRVNEMSGGGITLPRNIEWGVEDWEDFYITLRNFKLRVLNRHGVDPNAKPRRRRLRQAMKRRVTKDVTFCDACTQEGYVTPCLKCGTEYCYDCRNTLSVEYQQGVYRRSRDGVYCKPCDMELCETKADPLHQAYLAIKLLRDESVAFSKDFDRRTKFEESNLQRLLDLKRT